jgi:hypothetical protein
LTQLSRRKLELISSFIQLTMKKHAQTQETETMSESNSIVIHLWQNRLHTIDIRPLNLPIQSIYYLMTASVIRLQLENDPATADIQRIAETRVPKIPPRRVKLEPTQHVIDELLQIPLTITTTYATVHPESDDKVLILIHSTEEPSIVQSSSTKNKKRRQRINLLKSKNHVTPPVPRNINENNTEDETYSIKNNPLLNQTSTINYLSISGSLKLITRLEDELRPLFINQESIERKLVSHLTSSNREPRSNAFAYRFIQRKKYLIIVRLALANSNIWNQSLNLLLMDKIKSTFPSILSAPEPTVSRCLHFGSKIQSKADVKFLFTSLFLLHTNEERDEISKGNDHQCSFLLSCPIRSSMMNPIPGFKAGIQMNTVFENLVVDELYHDFHSIKLV